MGDADDRWPNSCRTRSRNAPAPARGPPLSAVAWRLSRSMLIASSGAQFLADSSMTCRSYQDARRLGPSMAVLYAPVIGDWMGRRRTFERTFAQPPSQAWRTVMISLTMPHVAADLGQPSWASVGRSLLDIPLAGVPNWLAWSGCDSLEPGAVQRHPEPRR